MPLACCFCNHGNPEQAKFCNECGSPLGLRPCTQCDGVNPRGVDRCHQCGTELPAVAQQELAGPTDSERIMKQADAMLAALQRDLAMATASVQTADRTPVEAPAPPAISAAEPEGAPPTVIGERRPGPPPEDVELWFDPTSAAERRWEERPQQGRRAMIAVLALAFFVAPAVVWTHRHPEQVHAWRDRVTGFLQGAPEPQQPIQRTGDAAPADAIAAGQPAAASALVEEAPAPSAAASEASASGAVATGASEAAPNEPPVTEAAPAPPAAAAAPETRSRSRASGKGRSRGAARRSQ